MAEYIERATFERALVEVYQGLGGYKTRDAFYKAIDIAHSFPKSDVTPVRHGRWIDAYPDIEPNPMFMYGICSECGFEQGISKYLSYCPNCGAKMDGGDSNSDMA